jgi:hypothetical protein
MNKTRFVYFSFRYLKTVEAGLIKYLRILKHLLENSREIKRNLEFRKEVGAPMF